MVKVSIIIPVYNVEPYLQQCLDSVHAQQDPSFEVILVDDGSTDKSWSVVKELSAENPAIRGISFRRNYGKSAALYHGFEAAKGNVVFTMDADLQDSPEEIPEMYRMIT